MSAGGESEMEVLVLFFRIMCSVTSINRYKNFKIMVFVGLFLPIENYIILY